MNALDRADGTRKTGHTDRQAPVADLDARRVLQVHCGEDRQGRQCRRALADVYTSRGVHVFVVRHQLVWDLGPSVAIETALPRSTWIAWTENERRVLVLGCDRCGTEPTFDVAAARAMVSAGRKSVAILGDGTFVG